MSEITCIKQLDDQLWAVDEQQKVTLFIINGSEKVLLIDTGSGLINLKKVIRDLCGTKPIAVINTHAHLDHTAGNNQFPAVYVGRYDEPESHLLEEIYKKSGEMAYFRQGISNKDLLGWNPGPAEHITPVKDGDTIDLGSLCMRVIEIPSHTLGSIALYEANKGWLFSGDMILSWEAWAWLPNSATLKQYYDSVNLLCKMNHCIKRLFPSHGQEKLKLDGYSRFELPVDILNIYRNGISDILLGNYEYEAFKYNGIIHEKSSKDIPKRKVTFSAGGIIFNPNRTGI